MRTPVGMPARHRLQNRGGHHIAGRGPDGREVSTTSAVPWAPLLPGPGTTTVWTGATRRSCSIIADNRLGREPSLIFCTKS